MQILIISVNCWNSLQRTRIGRFSRTEMLRYELREIGPKKAHTLQAAKPKKATSNYQLG